MNVKAVCIKLVTGETLFAELIADDEDPTLTESNLIKVYRPYSVMLTYNQNEKYTQFAMNPWVVFSNDLFYYIPASNVVSISGLDNSHSKLYGSAMLSAEVKEIRSTIVVDAKTGIIPSKKFENTLDKIVHTFLKYSVRYGLIVPSVEELKTSLNEFVMTVYNVPDNEMVKQ